MGNNADAVDLHETRKKWRKLAFDGLSNKQNYHDFDLDACLLHVQLKELMKEASAAAFWGAYIAEVLPFSLTETQEKTINLILNCPLPDNRLDPMYYDSVYAKFIMSGILALDKIRIGQPFAEFPSVVKLLENACAAERLLPLPAEANEEALADPSSWGWKYFFENLFIFSQELVSGILHLELSLVLTEQRNYEAAFTTTNAACWSLCQVRVTNELSEFHDLVPPIPLEMVEMGDFVPYMPHSLESYDIQHAVNIFEEIKRHPQGIQAWGAVRDCCDSLKDLGYNDLYDWLSDVRDLAGDIFGASEYWEKAITFAEFQMSLSTLPVSVLTRDAKEKMYTRDRLKRDYFAATWGNLTKQSQDFLIEAEIDWMHSRFGNMIKIIRPLLEIELIAIFPFLCPAINQDDPRLKLTRIRDAIKHNTAIGKSIKSLHIDPAIKQWIETYFPVYLSRVIDTRNFFEKEQVKFDKKSDEYNKYVAAAIAIHQELLGIQCRYEGVLPRLLNIKIRCKPK